MHLTGKDTDRHHPYTLRMKRSFQVKN